MNSNQNHLIIKVENTGIGQLAQVPAATPIDLSNPATAEVIKQGGSILSIALLCLFIWLLTKLIKVAKED